MVDGGLNAGTGVAVGYGAVPTNSPPLGIASGWQAGIVATAGSAEKSVPATLAVLSAVAATVTVSVAATVAVDTGTGVCVATGVGLPGSGDALGAVVMRVGTGRGDGARGVLEGEGVTVFGSNVGMGEAGTGAVSVGRAGDVAVGEGSGRTQPVSRPVRHATASVASKREVLTEIPFAIRRH